MRSIITSMRTEPWNDTACEHSSGNTRLQGEGCLPVHNGIVLVVTQYSSCELSKVSHETLFFEDDIAHINSTAARDPRVDHVPSLPRTQARGTCTLVPSSSVSAKAGTRIHATHALFVLPHLEHTSSHWSENLCKWCMSVYCEALICGSMLGRCYTLRWLVQQA